MIDNSSVVVELDPTLRGATLLALSDKRNQLLQEGRPTDAINEALVKIAHAPSKKRRDSREER